MSIVYWLLARFPRPLVVGASTLLLMVGVGTLLIGLLVGMLWLSALAQKYTVECVFLVAFIGWVWSLARLARWVNSQLPQRKPKD